MPKIKTRAKKTAGAAPKKTVSSKVNTARGRKPDATPDKVFFVGQERDGDNLVLSLSFNDKEGTRIPVAFVAVAKNGKIKLTQQA